MTFFDLVGHLSFALTAAAWLMKDVIKLRLIAIVSILMGIFYNATLETGPLWIAVSWLMLFLVINTVYVFRDVRNMLEIDLPPEQKIIASTAFPTMHSRDFLLLSRSAEVLELDEGDTIINVGQTTAHVFLLVYGSAVERRPDRPLMLRAPGMLWGELTFTIGRGAFDASPCEVAITTADALVWRWGYEDLRRLISGNDRLHAALSDAFVRSAGTKHGLLLQGRPHELSAPLASIRQKK